MFYIYIYFFLKKRVGRKPGSVEYNHSSRIVVTNYLMQPTQKFARNRRSEINQVLLYLVLLQVGFS